MKRRAYLGRFLKILVTALALFLVSLIVRYFYVQNQIKNTPVEISEYSTSGFTPKGVYGHGDLVSSNGEFGWYIYDTSDPVHGVRKACVYNVEPDPAWDVDFIYAHGQWFKLRSGLGKLTPNGFTAEPPTQDWKGLFSTQMTFPVRKPDLPYRAKILFAKLKNGSQSPLDYLQILKLTNPTCTNIPAP